MAVRDFILSQEFNVLKRKRLSSFYAYVNSNPTTPQSIPPLVDSNNNLAVSDQDKCIVLNDILLLFLLLTMVCSLYLCLVSLRKNDDGLLPVFVPRLSEDK